MIGTSRSSYKLYKYMNLGDKENLAYRPDAQPFDEVKFKVVPRYKTSGLSGDEWRISIEVEFWRNGKLKHTEWAGHDMQSAMGRAYHLLGQAQDEGKAYFAGEENFCDQEGCKKEATVRYEKIASYCREGHKTTPHYKEIRKFCNEHKTRGDCGLDDSDSNYKLVPPLKERGD